MVSSLLALLLPGLSRRHATGNQLVEIATDLHQEANEMDLSIELHFMAQIEQALCEVMQHKTCAMLSATAACGEFCLNSRLSSEIIHLLSEVNHHVLQCAQYQEEDTDISLPISLVEHASRHTIVLPSRMGDLCSQEFASSIVEALRAGVVTRLLKGGYGHAKRREQLISSSNRPDHKGAWEGISMDVSEFDVAASKAEGDLSRLEFLRELRLGPPKVLRVIDCQATCKANQVVLRDWEDSCVQAMGYTAISHTYGLDVYTVFNCRCATNCLAEEPRCSLGCCPHDPAASDAATTKHRQVVQDILNMCAILREAGVDYTWHDGVCIAQHKDSEVEDAIDHMGWIYSNAKDTIIFLHYVGKPMAPIRPSNDVDEMTSRWHTRVWTLQEAALSNCRRYCVRVGTTPLGDCKSAEEFQMKLALWYNDEFSKIEVIEEERFFEIVKSMNLILNSLRDAEEDNRISVWADCIFNLIETLQRVCFEFPAIDEALQLCSLRDSKHKGDRINSILTLARVTGFVAPKDHNVEDSTLKFFERQGKEGLALALFTMNGFLGVADRRDYVARRHTWLPVLSNPVQSIYIHKFGDDVSLTVMVDGKMELRGSLVGIKVRFMVMPNQPRGPFEPNDIVYFGEDAEGESNDESYGLESIGHDHVLNMNMTCHQSVIQGALAEAPSRCVGAFFFPLMGVLDLLSPTIDGKRPLQHGDSFLAHLVLLFEHSIVQALVVQRGESLQDGEVSRIGLFLPNTLFSDFALRLMEINSPHITRFESLIIH